MSWQEFSVGGERNRLRGGRAAVEADENLNLRCGTGRSWRSGIEVSLAENSCNSAALWHTALAFRPPDDCCGSIAHVEFERPGSLVAAPHLHPRSAAELDGPDRARSTRPLEGTDTRTPAEHLSGKGIFCCFQSFEQILAPSRRRPGKIRIGPAEQKYSAASTCCPRVSTLRFCRTMA